MRKIYIQKNLVVLSVLMMLTVLCFSQRKKVIVVGGDATNARAEDSVLIDSIAQWVDVVYLGSSQFNSAPEDSLYETANNGIGANGVIITESIGGGAVSNFANRDDFPVPSIVMEAAVFSGDETATDRWFLMQPPSTPGGTDGGGTWGFATPEAVDVQWKIAEDNHYITENYNINDIMSYAATPDRGVPYLHDFDAAIIILATAARESDPANVNFDQTKAVALGYIKSKDLLFMNVAYTYLAVGTNDLYNIIHRSVEFMFDAYPVSVQKVEKETFGLSVYPNPIESGFQVNFKAIDNQTASISLVNLAGQEVFTHSLNTTFGINRVELNVNTVASGIYLLKLEVDGQVTYEKVSVK